jgi:hypothetical protein
LIPAVAAVYRLRLFVIQLVAAPPHLVTPLAVAAVVVMVQCVLIQLALVAAAVMVQCVLIQLALVAAVGRTVSQVAVAAVAAAVLLHKKGVGCSKTHDLDPPFTFIAPKEKQGFN